MNREEQLRSRFIWIDTVAEATTTITRRPARTLLTALGTILGVAAFVTTTGLAATASAQVSESFGALKATEVWIQDANSDGSDPFPIDVEQRLEPLNGINHAGLFYPVPDDGTLIPRRTASRRLGSRLQEIPLVAATPGAIHAAQPVMAAGTIYNRFHLERAEAVVVLGRVAAEQLGITRIDNQPAVFIGDTGYMVIGILSDTNRNPDLLLAAIIPSTTEQRLIGTDSPASQVLIDTEPGAANLAGRQAPLALRPQDPDRLIAIVPPDPETLRNNVETDITTLYYALAALSLVVGTIAIANATLLSTIERRPEIGLRRALGAKRSHVTRQIILEAAITSTIAGFTGTAIAHDSDRRSRRRPQLDRGHRSLVVLSAPLIGLVTVVVAGSLPAARASRTPPAVTLGS